MCPWRFMKYTLGCSFAWGWYFKYKRTREFLRCFSIVVFCNITSSATSENIDQHHDSICDVFLPPRNFDQISFFRRSWPSMKFPSFSGQIIELSHKKSSCWRPLLWFEILGFAYSGLKYWVLHTAFCILFVRVYSVHLF